MGLNITHRNTSENRHLHVDLTGLGVVDYFWCLYIACEISVVNVDHNKSTIWKINPNQEGNVRVSLTFLFFSLNIADVEKQYVVHILSLCLQTSQAIQYNQVSFNIIIFVVSGCIISFTISHKRHNFRKIIF